MSIVSGTVAEDELVDIDPPHNAELDSSPDRITLRFPHPVDAEITTVRLLDQQGSDVSALTASFDEHSAGEVSLEPRAPLGPGTYTVTWKGQAPGQSTGATGFSTFAIAETGAVQQDSKSRQTPETSWASVLGRWFAYLGIAGSIAVWPLWLFLIRPALSPVWTIGPHFARRAQRFGLFSVAFALAGSVIELVGYASDHVADTKVAGSIEMTLTDTRFGGVWLIRIVLLLLLGLALTVAPWRSPYQHRLQTAVTACLSAIIALPVALSSNAAELGSGRAFAVTVDAVHVIGASLLVGGLFLAITLIPLSNLLASIERQALMSSTWPRIIPSMLLSGLAVVPTGAYLVWLGVDSFDALANTRYGATLAIKIAIVIILVVSAIWTIRCTPTAGNLRVPIGARFVGVILAGMTLAISAVLVYTVPGANIIFDSRDPIASRPFASDTWSGTIAISPAEPGRNSYVVDFDGAQPPEDTQVVLAWSLPFDDSLRVARPMTAQEDGTYRGNGFELSFPGEWAIETVVRPPQTDQESAFSTFAVGVGISTEATKSRAWLFSSHAIGAIILAFAALVAILIAIRTESPATRREASGIGAVAIVLCIGLLLMSRMDARTAGLVSLAQNPVQPGPDSLVTGQEIYNTQCLSCHGPAGAGDGPAGQDLVPPPADFHALHAFVHPDIEFFDWIENGKPGTGMPDFGDDLTDEEMWQVISYIRHLQDTGGIPSVVPATPESND